MRLICPNCDAQYEVDASLIPAEGRDVQCSACGHVWFQSPDDDEGDEELVDLAVMASPPVVPVEDTILADDDGHEDPQVLRRHSLDESMLAVLREEAERETRARAEETARAAARSLETQPELGLTDAPASRLRIRPRAQEAEEAPGPVVPAGGETRPAAPSLSNRAARRELLPDIEAINSTLNASSATRRGETSMTLPEPPERRRSGFRIGFGLMILLAVLAWGVYIQAPVLVRSMPAAEPVLDAYVTVVDQARMGLDALMQSALARLTD